MADQELENIKNNRLAELQSNAEGGNEERERRNQMEEMRASMLSQVLTSGARERLSRISIVKPEKSRAIEDLIIKMARSGQIRAKLEESHLIDMLDQLNQHQSDAKPKKVIYNRRRDDDEDDDEDYGF